MFFSYDVFSLSFTFFFLVDRAAFLGQESGGEGGASAEIHRRVALETGGRVSRLLLSSSLVVVLLLLSLLLWLWLLSRLSMSVSCRCR